MAVTRIKNNQITDKAITYAKIADTTITGGQLSADLVYASNLTVQGNLTVSGNTTVVDSTNTTVADPLTLLASGLSGSPSNDVGFLINRGSSIKQAIVWNEVNNEFAVFSTTATTGSTGSINNSGYTTFKAGEFKAGNLSMTGNSVTSTGDDLNLTAASGNVIATNLTVSSLTADRIPYTGVGGYLSTTTFLTFDPATGDFYAKSVQGGNLKLALNTLSSTDTDGNINISPNGAGLTKISNLSVTGLSANSVIVVDADGKFTTDGEFTFNGTTNALVLNGTANIGNISLANNTIGSIDANGNIELTPNGSGQVVASNVKITGGAMDNVIIGATTTANASFATANIGNAFVTALTSGRVTYASTNGELVDSANLTFNGTKLGTVDLEASGDISSANLKASGLTQDRVLLAGSAGALVDSANLTFSGTLLTVTGNVSANNLSAGDKVSTANLQVTAINQDKVLYTTTSGLVTSGNLGYDGTTLDVSASGNISAGNISTGYIVSSGSANAVTFNGNLAATNANVTGTADIGNLNVTGTFGVVDLSASGNVSANGTVSAIGNVSGGNLTTTGLIDATGNVSGGNLTTVGDVAGNNIIATNNANATTFNGNLDGTSSTVTGNSNASIFNGNLVGTYANVSGNVDGGNLVTGGVVSATGNVSGGNLTTVGDVAGNNIIATNNANAVTFNGNLDGTSSTVTGNSNASIFNGNLVGSYANVTGNVDGGNLITGGVVSATGNVSGGNLTTVGDVAGNNIIATNNANATTFNGNLDGTTSTVTGNSNASIFNGNLVGSYANVTGNVDGGNLITGGIVSATGNVSGGNLTTVGEVAGNNAVFSTTANAATFNGNLDGTTSTVTGNSNAAIFNGNLVGSYANITGNLDAGNANVTSLLTAGNANVTGTVDSGNANVTGLITAGNANVTGLVTAGNATVSSLTSGRVVLAGTSGALVDSGNLTFNGTALTVAGEVVADNANIANITLTTDTITNTVLNADLKFATTGTGNINFNGLTVGNVADPTSQQDVVTVAYLESQLTSAITQISEGDSSVVVTDSGTGNIVTTVDGTVVSYAVAAGTTFIGNATVDNVKISGNTITTIGGDELNLDSDTGVIMANGDLHITGNLQIGGVQTIVDTTTVAIVDPVINLGTGANSAVLTTDDGYDRGLELHYYHSAGGAKQAALIMDNSDDKLYFYKDATVAAGAYSGTLGNVIVAGFEGNSIAIDGNASVGNITATDSVSGNNIVATNNSNANVFNGNTMEIALTANITGNLAAGNISTAGDAGVTGTLTAGNIKASALTSGRVTFAGTDGLLSDSQGLTYDLATGTLSTGGANLSGTVTAANITDSALTSGRVTFAGTAGLLSDDADLTFDTAANELTVTNANVTGNLIVGGTLDLGLTSTYVQFGGASGEISEDSTFTFNSATSVLAVGNANVSGSLVAGNITDSALTSGRVTFAGTAGLLSDDADLTFDTATNTLTVVNANITGNLEVGGTLDLGLTASYVQFGGASGEFAEDSAFTFDTAGKELGVGNANVTGTLVAAHIKDSALTSTRVVFSTTNGELTDEAGFEYDTVTDTLTVANANVTGNLEVGGTLDLGITTGYVVFGGATGEVAEDSAFTFDTAGKVLGVGNANVSGSIVAGNITDSALTSGRVTFAGTAGLLSDDAGFEYDTVTDTLTVANANITGNLELSGTLDLGITTGYVVFGGATGEVAEDSAFTFDTTSKELAVGNANVTGTLVSAHIKDSALTSGRVVFSTTSGELTDEAGFEYDNATDTLSVVTANASGQINANTLSVTNNANVGNLGTGGFITATGNITAANFFTSGSGGDISGVNDVSTVSVTATGNISAGNISSSGDSNAVGFYGTTANLTGNIGASHVFANIEGSTGAFTSLTAGEMVFADTGGILESDANLTYNVSTSALALSGSANITGTIDVSSTATVGSLIVDDLAQYSVLVAGVNGQVFDPTNFTYNDANSTVTVNGNINVGNLQLRDNTLSSTNLNGNIEITPDGTGKTVIKNAVLSGFTGSRVLVTNSSGEVTVDEDLTWDDTTNILSANGSANIAGNLTVANIKVSNNDVESVGGNINITPNGTNATVVTNFVSSNVEITGGNINGTAVGATTASTGAFTDLSASGNANLGNTFVSTLTSGRVTYAGASGLLVDDADFTFDGTDLTVAGNIYVGNLLISGNDITAQTGGEITVNTAGSNIDFIISGSADASLFHVSGGQNNIGINTNTPNTEAKLHIVSTNSIIIPIGADGDRPISPVAGMMRFNSSQNSYEGYNGTAWQSFSSASTVITSETFNGDGSAVEFTLGQELTTAAAIVAVNGVMQIPTTAYSISGVTLTFTEAPASGDVIEVRQIATTSTINVTLQSPNGFNLAEATNSGVTIYSGTASAAARWIVGTNGHFVPAVDNALDVGAVGNAVRNITYSGALVHSKTAATVGTTITAIDTFTAATYRTAKYVIQVTNQGGTAFDAMEALVIHDGTTAYLTVSNHIFTGSELGTLSVDLAGGSVVLKYTGVGPANVVKLGKSYITV